MTVGPSNRSSSSPPAGSGLPRCGGHSMGIGNRPLVDAGAPCVGGRRRRARQTTACFAPPHTKHSVSSVWSSEAASRIMPRSGFNSSTTTAGSPQKQAISRIGNDGGTAADASSGTAMARAASSELVAHR